MARDPLIKLQHFALQQHGHVSHDQAVSIGVTRDDLYRLSKRKAIIRVHPRVYRLASAPVTFLGRATAAVLAGGERAVLSHSWAAKLCGITRIPVTEQPEITCPGTHPPHIGDVTVHSSRALDRCDVTTSYGIPATSGARTAVDLRHDRLDAVSIMGLVDDLITLEATSRRWQYQRACQLVHGRAGIQSIIRITRPGAEGEFRSWLERHFNTVVVHAYELPQPVYNVPLHDHRGQIGIADALWQLNREVVVELDGLRFHRLSQDRRRDSHKTNRYVLSGRITLRFSYEDVVRNPHGVAEQLRQALNAARR